jgi:hypothetical protein
VIVAARSLPYHAQTRFSSPANSGPATPPAMTHGQDGERFDRLMDRSSAFGSYQANATYARRVVRRLGLRSAKFVMRRNSDFLLTPPQLRCHISSTCAAIGEDRNHGAGFLVNPRGAGDGGASSPARRRGHPNHSLGGCPPLDEHLLGLAPIQAGTPRSGSPRCDEASVASTRGS